MFSHTWQLPLVGGTRLYSDAALTWLGRGAQLSPSHTVSAKKLKRVFYSLPLARLFIAGIASRVRWPNKALEPTPTSVTPRADARVAPAAVVAHL